MIIGMRRTMVHGARETGEKASIERDREVRDQGINFKYVQIFGGNYVKTKIGD